MVLLKIFATIKSERSIEMVFFSGEETGCWGSSEYVKHHKSELNNCICFINNDGAGSAVVIDRNVLYTSPSTERLALRVAKEMDWPFSSITAANIPFPYSDHGAFAFAGVPVVWFTEPAFPEFHTEEDGISRINFEKLSSHTKLVGQFAWEIIYSYNIYTPPPAK